MNLNTEFPIVKKDLEDLKNKFKFQTQGLKGELSDSWREVVAMKRDFDVFKRAMQIELDRLRKENQSQAIQIIKLTQEVLNLRNGDKNLEGTLQKVRTHLETQLESVKKNDEMLTEYFYRTAPKYLKDKDYPLFKNYKES